MNKLAKIFGVMMIVLALIAVGACDDDDDDDTQTGAQPENKGPVVVGSKIDTEGALLANMIIMMLEDNGFDVTDKSETGTTPIVKAALENGEIDIYPEYTGNGAFFFSEADSEVWKDAQAGYERVKELDMQNFNIDWLSPAPANNTWAIAIPQELAKAESLESLEGFASYVNNGGYVKLIGSEEFITSPAALPSFQEVYGFTLKGDQLLSISGGNTSLTEKSAAEGTDGVNAAMAYGTDGQLAALGLVVLSDPEGAQPVYEPAPRVRGEILQMYPEIADILNPVFESLNLEDLQMLNSKIAVEGQIASDVAREYLISEGFLS